MRGTSLVPACVITYSRRGLSGDSCLHKVMLGLRKHDRFLLENALSVKNKCEIYFYYQSHYRLRGEKRAKEIERRDTFREASQGKIDSLTAGMATHDVTRVKQCIASHQVFAMPKINWIEIL